MRAIILKGSYDLQRHSMQQTGNLDLIEKI